MKKKENYNFLGENISNLLYLQRKQQLWLAEQCNVTPSHINQIIKGKTQPSLSVLVRMADALNVTVNELIIGTKA